MNTDQPDWQAPGSARRPRAAIWATLLLFAAASIWGCARRQDPPRLVLLFMPCTVNASFLGPYNPQVDYTPNLSAWAKRSVVFQRHQTEAGQSGTAFASLLSGAPTAQHGVFTNGNEVPDSLEMIFETYAANGYDVHAWLRQSIVRSFNYAQGVREDRISSDVLTGDDPGFQEILASLGADPGYRALVVTAFSVTHGPYQRFWVDEFCGRYPAECGPLADRERYDRYLDLFHDQEYYRPLSYDFPNVARRLGLSQTDVREMADAVELTYKSAVYHLDQIFGGLMAAVEAAELLDETLLALVADHGEVLYRNNALFPWSHGLILAPETLRVPFMLFAPRLIESPRAYEGVTRAIDVFPTVAGLSGLTAPSGPGFGRDLSGALLGDDRPPELLAFSHSTVAGRPDEAPMDVHKLSYFPDRDPRHLWVSVRSGDLVFKRTSPNGFDFETQLYHLGNDPEERRDLFDPTDPYHRKMEALLIEYKERLVRAYFEHPTAADDDWEGEQLEALRSLGYVQ